MPSWKRLQGYGDTFTGDVTGKINNVAVSTITNTVDLFTNANSIATASLASSLQVGSTLTVDGTLYVSENIRHSGDTNNYINFTTDTQKFYTDNALTLTLDAHQGATFAGEVAVDGSLTVDECFEAEAGGDVLITGGLECESATTFGDEVAVDGKIEGGDGMDITGDVDISGGIASGGHLSAATLETSSNATFAGTITAAGLGLSANGSLGSPVIFRSSDTNTGLCFLGTDSLGLVAGASAGTKLQITGVNDASKIVTGTQDVDAGLFLDFASDDSQGDWKFYLGDWDGEANETFLMVDDVENEIILTCGTVHTTAGGFNIDSSAHAVVSIDRGATSRFGCTNYKTAGSTIWSTGLTDSDNAGVDGSEYYIGPSQGGAWPAFLLATNGDLTLTGIVSTVGRVQITGNGTPTVTGGGIELGYTSNTGKILAYDRSGGGSYKALELNGSSHKIKVSGSEKFSINTSGNATFAGNVGVTGKVTAGNDAYNANPDVELAVFGRFYCDTYGYPFIVHDSSAGDNLFEVDGGDCVKIDPEGNLGATEFGGGITIDGQMSGVSNMATITSDIDNSPTIYVDDDAPSGGSSGDIWLEY